MVEFKQKTFTDEELRRAYHEYLAKKGQPSDVRDAPARQGSSQGRTQPAPDASNPTTGEIQTQVGK